MTRSELLLWAGGVTFFEMVEVDEGGEVLCRCGGLGSSGGGARVLSIGETLALLLVLPLLSLALRSSCSDLGVLGESSEANVQFSS